MRKFELLARDGRFHIVNASAPADLQPCIVHSCDDQAEAHYTLAVVNYCAQIDAEIQARHQARPVNLLQLLPSCLN